MNINKNTFVQHLEKVIAGAIRDVEKAHGNILVGSVAKRVACQLWADERDYQTNKVKKLPSIHYCHIYISNIYYWCINTLNKFMTSIILKVSDKIPKELDVIQEEEGLGNRTSTITFLIKYYFLTKKSSLDQSIQLMDKLLDRIDTKKLPSAKEQLKDI